MKTYTNSISFAANESKSEVMLSFYQNAPDIDMKGEITGETRTLVSELVMTRECAEGLIRGLAGVLEAEH